MTINAILAIITRVTVPTIVTFVAVITPRTFTARNTGVATPKSDYTESTESKMKYLREELKNMGEFWNTRTATFLCNNSNLFPLYNATSEDMYASVQQYDCDLYLDDRYCDLSLEELKFLKKYLS